MGFVIHQEGQGKPAKNRRARSLSQQRTYEAIQKEKQDIKALFISGYTGDIVLDKGIHDKAYDYISKPLSPKELLHEFREILDK
jgi:CheY-like chemotaxis protein